ncbi:hypothetical protein KBD69_03195 [Candidatus Woesebacteria bacterium]|nr:hypothetical protein [Candidatus Woesebacteria bacterium]
MQTSYNATFTSKGQLTFPSAIRKLHGIKAGHSAKFIKHNRKTGLITIKIESKLDIVDQLAGSLHRPGMIYVPIEKVREIAGYALGKKYQIKNEN